MSIFKLPQNLESGTDTRSLAEVHTWVSEKRDTGNAWYLSARVFPQGFVETVALKLDSEQSLKRGGGAKRVSKEKSDMTEHVLNKSQRRAKKTIRHKLFMVEADRLLTLTYRENQTDIQQAWIDFDRFRRLMNQRYGDKFKYVAVPEYQKRGAVHFHLAIKGYFPANAVRRIWRRVVGEGNIDITAPRKINKTSWNPKRIAGYLAKYISKNDSVEMNKRRYSSTRNIEIPKPITGWIALGVSIVSIQHQIIKSFTRREATVVWDGDSYFPISVVST